MQIIDRYLAGQYARTFLIFFLSFTGLYIVVDVFSNLDEFLSQGQREGSVAGVIAEYYGYRSLAFFNKTSSVLALIAAMFTLTGFQRNNEMTALLAAGIPKRRVLAPIVICAGMISLISLVNREVVLPSVRHNLDRDTRDLSGDSATPLKPRYDYKTNIFLSGHCTFSNEMRIHKPNFRLPAGLNQYGSTIAAEKAVYERPRDGRPGGYRFSSVSQPTEIAKKKSLFLGGAKVVFMPRDTLWLKSDECFIASEVTFEQLEGGSGWREFASTGELISGLHNESLDFGGDVRVAIHSRIVQPLLDMTLLFVGLPLVLTRENRNVFLAIAQCGLVVLAFMLVVIGCQYLGANSLISASRAAWLPLAIFIPLGVMMSDTLRH